jgi:dihydroxy-acid dehydratase
VKISEDEIKARLAKWKKPAVKYKRGVMAKYAATVCSSSIGAVTDLIDSK